jgi:glycosyltransferase involved in cell wall biosynthesis
VRKIRFWTINGDFIRLRPTGVARYAKEVTIALDQLVSRHHPLTEDLELRLVAPCEATHISFNAIRVRTVREFSAPRIPQFWVQAQLPRFVRGGLLSFCNLAPVSIAKQIVCIHDLHTMLMPQSYSLSFRLAHRLILPALGRKVRRLTTVSHLSKSHLVNHGIAPAHKITVTYNGCDHALRWNSRNTSLTYGPRPFVFFLGQPQKYKNLELIWRIAPALHQQGIDVYVAGGMTGVDFRAHGEMAPNLRLLGSISDDSLAGAFENALCFLFPSRIEGFGLPLVEAMARGCPVIASASACLPEVGGDAALYCEPDDPDGWIDRITQLRSNHSLRNNLIGKGLDRAKEYSWNNVALKYLNLMAEIDEFGAGLGSPHSH